MTQIDRRKFLGYAAAAGAGLLLAHRRAEAAPGKRKGSTDEIRIGLIGAGTQGQVLMNSCLKIPGVRFQAVCVVPSACSRNSARM